MNWIGKMIIVEIIIGLLFVGACYFFNKAIHKDIFKK